MGLLDAFNRPETAMWLGGLGQALSSAGQGRGFDMGQTNTMLMQSMQRKRAEEKLKGLMDQFGLTPQQRGLMEVYSGMDPSGAMGVLAGQAFPKDNDSALEQKVRMLEQAGVDRQTAINIAAGRYTTSRDPITGVAQIVDKATGQVVGRPQGGGGASQQAQPTQQAPEAPLAAEPLYGQAQEATGVVPSLKELATDTLGQLPGAAGEAFQFPETVEKRQNFRTATAELIRAMSINPRFPVAEMERIREEIAVLPGATLSGEGLQARMRSVDRMLRQRLETERATAQDESMPPEARQSAIQNANAIQNFLRVMGVPQGGEAAPQQAAPQVPQEFQGLPAVGEDGRGYEQIPPGALFIAPDGTVRRKP